MNYTKLGGISIIPIELFWEKGVDRRSIEIVSEAIRNLRRITTSNLEVALMGHGPRENPMFIDDLLESSMLENGTVDANEFLAKLTTEFLTNKLMQKKRDLNPTIVISRRHIRTEKENFLFGATEKPIKILPSEYSSVRLEARIATILSTHHFMKSYEKNWELPFLLITYHEIGHLFGAPRSNRTDLEDLIGKHCKNRNCAMEQVNVNGKLDALEKVKYVDLDSPYCNQCLEDIRIGITSWKKLKEKLKASDGRDELQS